MSQAIRNVNIDALANALCVIDYEHQEIHGGDSYHTGFISSDLADDATIILAFKTPASQKWAHMIAAWGVKTEAELAIHEGADWLSDTGSLNPIYNRNRNASDASMLMENKTTPTAFSDTDNVLLNPTSFVSGTIIERDWTWADKKAGARARGNHEWILKSDTQYAVVLSARAATSGGFIDLDWYEHANR